MSFTFSSKTKRGRPSRNEAVEELHWLKQTRTAWLYLDCVFFMPERRIRDSHNMLKLLLDVMEGNVFENDYFVMTRVLINSWKSLT
ncbi:RusA family crossover junction endodeoxyribonuclease [Alicyclobacillus mengziensis]|nr:hypothetical protein [Alicyclobacillus mengziensis]